MAKRIGRDWDVAISSTDGSYTEIGNIKQVDVSQPHDRIDASDNDSSGYNEGEYGQSQVTISLTANYNKADAGQLELQQASEGKSKVWLRARPKGTSSEREIRAQYTIDNYDLGGGTGDIQEMTAAFTSDGTLTFADQ